MQKVSLIKNSSYINVLYSPGHILFNIFHKTLPVPCSCEINKLGTSIYKIQKFSLEENRLLLQHQILMPFGYVCWSEGWIKCKAHHWQPHPLEGSISQKTTLFPFVQTCNTHSILMMEFSQFVEVSDPTKCDCLMYPSQT